MLMRIGKVMNVFPSTGKISVEYEDENNVSTQLPMLTMNNEYSMPQKGDRVVTIHMENGSSKGFVFGTYYGGGTQPKANGGYRKDFGNGAYVICNGGAYQLIASKVNIKSDGPVEIKNTGSEASMILDTETVIKATSVEVQADNITLKCSYGEITVEELMKRLERIEDNLGLPHTIE